MFQNDRKIRISTGGSRKATVWTEQQLFWSDFVAKLSNPIRTTETFIEYKSLPKAKQDEIKDVGGFVGGVLTGGRRKNENAGERDLITLDADTLEPGGTQRILTVLTSLGCAYAVYSTRKHEGAAPRLRIIFPMDRSCSPDEYEPIARRMASFLDMNIFDPTTFETVRLMYWPSCSKDSEYVFCYEDKPFVSADGILGLYQDWRNVAEWPEVPGAAKIRDRSAKKQGDPLEKKGVVGAFCRLYSIEQAMTEFIPGEYTECTDPGRYTYTGGSTVGGAVLYDDKFIYSHHATDPCSGRLCNAFDMVRLHLFGDEDIDALPETPVTNLPSYKHMCEYAIALPIVQEEITKEKIQTVSQAFAEPFSKDSTNATILQNQLELTAKGAVLSTPGNVNFILSSDQRFLQAGVYQEEFTNRTMVYGCLPGSGRKGPRKWDDQDDSWLVDFLWVNFHIKGDQIIKHGFNRYLEGHRRHIVREWLNSLVWDGTPRLDTLLPDYLGTDNNEYTQMIMRITLCAAVARVMHPGTKFDSMMVIYGAQGIGKSTFPRMIAGDQWFSDNLTISDMRDKTGCEKIQGYLIIEIPELAGLYNADLELTKSFMTRTVDIFRPAFGRYTIERPRQCVFIGTTNKHDFLKDKTGNRRYWPVEAGVHNPKKDVFTELKKEAPQIWAEALFRYRAGQELYLTPELEQYALQEQVSHTESDPREEIIRDFVTKRVTEDWYQKTLSDRVAFWGYTKEGTVERTRIGAIEVWCECLHGAKEQFTKKEAAWINDILRNIPGWKPAHVRLGCAYSERTRGFSKE